MANALIPLSTTTLSASAATVSFSAISQLYRDLVITFTGAAVSGGSNAILMRLNGDTGTNYYNVYLYNSGSTGASGSSNLNGAETMRVSATKSDGVTTIFDYTQSRHKISTTRGDSPGAYTVLYANRWANTAAVTSIDLTNAGGQSFATGTTFSLFGVVA